MKLNEWNVLQVKWDGKTFRHRVNGGPWLALLPLAIAVATVACSPACPNETATPEQRANAPKDCPKEPVVDAGRDVNAPLPRTCAGACTRARDLRCSIGNPTPNGASCEKVCQNVQENNAGAGFNIGCMVDAQTCSTLEACR